MTKTHNVCLSDQEAIQKLRDMAHEDYKSHAAFVAYCIHQEHARRQEHKTTDRGEQGYKVDKED